MKRVISKTIAMICIVSMILGLYQPVSVKAYAYQNSKMSKIYVGDKYIIKTGKLLQTVVAGDKGTATYDVVNNILTLDNFESNSPISINYLDGIKIIIKGTNCIYNTTGIAVEIEQNGTAEIIGFGNGSLKVVSGNELDEGGGISCSGENLKLQNLNLDILTTSAGALGANTLNVNNCYIKSKTYINQYMSAPEKQYIFDKNISCAIGASKIDIKNSTIDAEGIRCGISYDPGLTIDSDAKVTDINGNNLYPLYVHLRGNIYTYVHSKQQLSTTYEGYGIAERHVIIKNYHNLTKHEAVAPTCTHGGNIEYYTCASCGTYYSDSEAANTITYEETILPTDSSRHTPKAAVKENVVNATKSKAGSYDEVVYCAECNAEISRVKKTIPKLGSEDSSNSDNANNTNDSSNNGGGNSSDGNNNDSSGTDSGTASDSTTVSDSTSSTKQDTKTTSFRKLMARVTSNTNSSLKLKWNKVKGADGYLVYAKKCASKGSYKKIKTIKKNSTTSYTQKKLKKGTYYQYKVVAYKTKGNKKYIISTSMPVYATTKGGKYTNPKSVRIIKPDRAKKKSEVIIKKGKKVQLKANIQKGKQAVKEYRKLSYETSNKKIATVSSKGVIKGIRRGTCYVYVYAQNGVYRKVKVTIR